jgi:hypothetical protein
MTKGCPRESNGLYKGFETNIFAKGDAQVIAFGGGAQLSNLLTESLKHDIRSYGNMTEKEQKSAVEEIHGAYGEKRSFVPFFEIMDDGRTDIRTESVKSMLYEIKKSMEQQKDAAQEKQVIDR